MGINKKINKLNNKKLVTMDKTLHERFMESSKAFYLNVGEISMTDQEWDSYFSKLNINKDDLFTMIGMDQSRDHNFVRLAPELPKIKVTEYDQIPKSEVDFYDTYKYDGSSVIAIYSESGKLRSILSSSGILQTQKLINHFPSRVPIGIERLYGEAVVDVNVYGDTARNYANGLVNSKYKQSEVDENLKIIIFNCDYREDMALNEHIFKDKLNFITPTSTYTRAKFMPEKGYIENLITPVTANVPELGIVTYIDGIVRYTETYNHIYKLYYHESAVSEVIQHTLTYKNTGMYSVKLRINPIRIEGVNISQVSASLRSMIERGMGIGSEVQVIRSGQTIPKVNKVVKTSDSFDLKCTCGTKLEYKDAVSNNVKCSNPECSRLEALYKVELNDDVFNRLMINNDTPLLVSMLKLPAFRKYNPDSFINFNIKYYFINRLGEDYTEEIFVNDLLRRLPMSGNQRKCFDLNVKMLYKIIYNKVHGYNN